MSRRDWVFRDRKCFYSLWNPWKRRVPIYHTILNFRCILRHISFWGTIIWRPLCHGDRPRRDEFDDSVILTVECQRRVRNEFPSDLSLLKIKRDGVCGLHLKEDHLLREPTLWVQLTLQYGRRSTSRMVVFLMVIFKVVIKVLNLQDF